MAVIKTRINANNCNAIMSTETDICIEIILFNCFLRKKNIFLRNVLKKCFKISVLRATKKLDKIKIFFVRR